MPGEKMLISLGLEDRYGVPDIVEIGISGVFYRGVPGLVEILVPSHSIPGSFDSISPIIVSIGYSISDPD